MNSTSRVVALALAAVGQLMAVSARSQAADTLTKGKADGSIATASTPLDTAPKKKGGMFGKLKGIAHNKTVQNITKAAVCQALPGGQYMVGAAEAAKNKTSVASGVANAQSCIPGIGGVGGMPGGLPGKGGLAGVGAAGAMGALSGSATGQAAAQGAAQTAAMHGMTKGLPGGGVAQTAATMATAMQQMQAASITMGGTGGDAFSTEAPGEQLKLSGTVADEIKKGKLTIKKVDWIHGTANVSASTTQGFMNLMVSAGQAMKAAGGNYRVDMYVDKKYSDEDIATIGALRTTVVVSSLQAGGQLGDAIVAGKIGKDKEQRIEIVKVK